MFDYLPPPLDDGKIYDATIATPITPTTKKMSWLLSANAPGKLPNPLKKLPNPLTAFLRASMTPESFKPYPT